MKHISHLFFCLFIIVISFSVNAQDKYFTKQQIQADISYLKTELEKTHPTLYKYTTKERFDFVCDSLLKSAPEKADLRQVFVHLLKMIRAIKCGHTYLEPINKELIPKAGNKLLVFPFSPQFFPFEIYIKDERIFISRSYVKKGSDFGRGDEILSINKTPAKQILNIVQAYNFQHPDGDNTYGEKFFLTSNFKFLIYLWLGRQEAYSLKIKRMNNEVAENIEVSPISIEEFLLIDKDRNIENVYDNTNISFSVIDSLKSTAYLRVKAFQNVGYTSDFFSGTVPIPDFEKRIKNVFKDVKKDNIQNLIIDFRGNLGGNISLANNVLSYLIPNQFTSAQLSIREGAISKLPVSHDLLSPNPAKNFKNRIDGDFIQYDYSNFRVAPKEDLVFKGNIYVLINGGTFSAASYLTSKLYDSGIGTFIGVPIGGAYFGTSGGCFSKLKLPNTSLNVNVPLMRVLFNVNPQKYQKTHLKPDFEVPLSFDDFLKKQDTAMKFTTELIKKGKKVR